MVTGSEKVKPSSLARRPKSNRSVTLMFFFVFLSIMRRLGSFLNDVLYKSSSYSVENMQSIYAIKVPSVEDAENTRQQIIDNHQTLEELYIEESSNYSTTLIKNWPTVNFAELTTVSLRSNVLDDTDLVGFMRSSQLLWMSRLRLLILSENKITNDVLPSLMNTIVNIEKLHLSYNMFSGKSLATLVANARQLTELWMNGNKIQNFEISDIACTKLELLQLHDCSMDDNGLNEIKKLVVHQVPLRVLHLGHNKFSDSAINELLSVQSELQFLNLAENKQDIFANLAAMTFSYTPRLKKLILPGKRRDHSHNINILFSGEYSKT